MREMLAAKTLHFLGLALWIGGLLTVGWLLVFRDGEKDDAWKTRIGALARRLAMSADIGATLSIASGVYMAWVLDAWKERWLQLKLGDIALLVVIHAVVRVKAKQAARGEGTFPTLILPVVIAGTGAVLYLAVFKP